MTDWTNHVKKFSTDNGVTYKQALTEAGPSWKEMKGDSRKPNKGSNKPKFTKKKITTKKALEE